MPYTLSNDYAALYSLLLQGEEVVGWYEWDKKKYLVRLYQSIASENMVMTGESSFLTISPLEFTEKLTRLSLSFIPQHDVAKIAESACKQLLQAIADGFRQNVAKADTISDMAVFQAIADTITNFPIPTPVMPL